MRSAQDFVISSCTCMVDYIATVSSTGPAPVPETKTQDDSSRALDRHEKMRILNAVNQRHRRVPVLHREAIPLLPHMIDLPKHLAVITSMVVRHTRRQLPTRSGAQTEEVFDQFCQSCLQVEEQALRRVSQLALRRRAKSVASPNGTSFGVPAPSAVGRRGSMGPNKLRSRRSKVYRPATAPDEDASVFYSKESSEDVSPHSSPMKGKAHVATSVATVTSPSSPPSSYKPDALVGAEPQSMPVPRPPFMHHPRSSSTDSALARKPTVSRSPSMPMGYEPTSDNPDDSIRKSKGLLRGILRR